MLIRNLTERQAAEITGYSVHWLRRKRMYGGGPPYRKFAKAPRYPEDELKKWIDAYVVVTSHEQLKGKFNPETSNLRGFIG